MEKIQTIIIGAGPAGITAAISAARKGETVLICEKLPQIGKKLLISGNGRCNLSNEFLSESFYKQSARELVKSVFSKFGKKEIAGFFDELGLKMYSKDNRIFPVTNQAASVLKALEMELARLKISLELQFEVAGIVDTKDGFTIISKDKRKLQCQKLIIACGGKSYPALGSDGSAYQLARQFGHKITEPVPVAVPVVVKSPLCHLLQGVRISALCKAIVSGKETSQAQGELLFTKYGLSGTAVFDISEDISIAINRYNNNNVFILIDLVPFMKKDELKEELSARLKKGISAQELLIGILPNKFGAALKDLVANKKIDDIINSLKELRLGVCGTRGWNEAEFTDGGISADGIKKGTLESNLKEGLYFAGEAIDTGGKRGGYHLAWAWASGFTAGRTQ